VADFSGIGQNPAMVDVPGQLVRAYRERLGLSQAQFAEVLGVSQALISTVELGRGPVSRRMTRALREASESGELRPGFQDFLDGSGERLWVPGVNPEMRAFRFAPPPPLLAPDSVAVFQPSKLSELVRDQVGLLQLRGRHAARPLRAGVGHLGRVVTSRTTGRILCQFEPATANVPIIDVTERSVQALFVCTFRGRYTV
jgi:transcriptional regulator with XRE-family HTH domain